MVLNLKYNGQIQRGVRIRFIAHTKKSCDFGFVVYFDTKLVYPEYSFGYLLIVNPVVLVLCILLVQTRVCFAETPMSMLLTTHPRSIHWKVLRNGVKKLKVETKWKVENVGPFMLILVEFSFIRWRFSPFMNKKPTKGSSHTKEFSTWSVEINLIIKNILLSMQRKNNNEKASVLVTLLNNFHLRYCYVVVATERIYDGQ